MADDDRHDRVRVAVVFTCGAVFGMILAFWAVVEVRDGARFIAGILAGALAGGLFAVRFGIRFWEAVRHLGWFVP